MIRKYIYFISGVAAVIILSLLCLAHRHFIVQDPISLIIGGLNDADWQKRDSAVNDLLFHKELLRDKKISDQVIDLLNREVSENRKREGEVAIELHVQKYGEGYGEYFLDILDLARNINDKRIIPGLIDSIDSGRGVWEALARFGDNAVDPTIKIFRTSQDDLKRENSIHVLSLMNQQHISKESRDKIRQVFLDALKDKSSYVREAGDRALKK